MMKKGLFFLIILISQFAIKRIAYSNSQLNTMYDKNDTTEIDLRKKRNLINSYYEKSFGRDSLKYMKLLFEEFPNSFEELYYLFSYFKNNEKKINPLSYEIFYRFNDTYKVVDRAQFYIKLINSSIGGKYEVDGINFYQGVLINRVLLEPDLIFSLLESKQKVEIEKFFFMFYDSPHGGYFKTIPKQFKKLKDKYPIVYKMSEKAFNTVKTNYHH